MGKKKKKPKDKKPELANANPNLIAEMLRLSETEEDQLLRMKVEKQLIAKGEQKEKSRLEKLKTRIQEIKEKAKEMQQERVAKINPEVLFYNEIAIFYDLVSREKNLSQVQQIFLRLRTIKDHAQKLFGSSDLVLDIETILEKFMMKDAPVIDEEESLFLESRIVSWLSTLYKKIRFKLASEIESETETVELDSLESSLEEMELRNQLDTIRKTYEQRVAVSILFFDKVAATLLFQHDFQPMLLQPDLITGFLSAIQSFAGEIMKKETKMRSLSFAEFNIELFEGEFARLALFLKGPITSDLRIKCSHSLGAFEKQFKAELMEFDGKISRFKIFEKEILDIF